MLPISAVLSQLLPRSISGLKEICSQNLCSGNGYCSINDDTADAECSCFNGYEGETCEFNVKDLVCLEMDCGFSGTQGECVLDATNEGSCYCYSGWEGTDCSISLLETSVDYCWGIACNERGDCVEDFTSENNWSCICHPGWSGETCGTQLHECGHDFLLDIYTRLVFLTDDLGASSECAYAKPVIFSAVTPAASDPFTYPYCICASLLSNFAYEDYNHLLNTCNMDGYRNLEFIKEAEMYCPGCNEDQDAIMEDVITTKSAACYHFVYKRATMGLYWRSRWKCGCIMDIGNVASTTTIVSCPFTQHTSKDDMISWKNCGSRKVCDWQSMYIWFENVYSKINLDGSVACKDWMEAWIFTVPGEQRFEFMSDSFCPCLDYLKGTGEHFQEILDCIPVTFHQLSMLDLYTEICYDPLIANHDCLNFIGYGAIQLGVVNYTAASICYGAVELASSLDTMTDNLHTLTCDCIAPLYNDDDFSLDDTILNALDCVNEYFTFDVTNCPQYEGASVDTWDPEIGNKGDMNDDRKETERIGGASFSASLFSSSSSWETITILEMPFCVMLLISAFYLQRRKMKLNM